MSFFSACSKKLAELQETQGDGPRIVLQKSGGVTGGGGGRSPQTQPNVQSSNTTITASFNGNKEMRESSVRPLNEKKLSPVISDATNGMSKIRRKTKYPINSICLKLPF